jgi:hypothetical protein
LVVLSDDYFSVSDEEKIRNIQSMLTIVGGKIVYAMNDFKHLAPQPLPIKPSWSPVAAFGGYYTHNNAIFSSSDNYSGTSNKNTEDEKATAKDELISSNTQKESTTNLNYQTNKNNENNNLSYYYTKADKNTNNKSIMQRGLCSCCDDFFSF